MKTFIVASIVLLLTAMFLFLSLDAGAREADLGLFFAPANSLSGLALCVLAFRRHLIWMGIMGVFMMVLWPFFTLALELQPKGVLRQWALGTIGAVYAAMGGVCFYYVIKREWGTLRSSKSR